MRTELSRVETIHFDRNFQLSITVLRFLNRFFFFWGGWWKPQKRWYLFIYNIINILYIYIRFSKNRELWRARNPVNNSVLATFGDWNCGIYVISLHLTAPHCVKNNLCALFTFNFWTSAALQTFFTFFNQKHSKQIEASLPDLPHKKRTANFQKSSNSSWIYSKSNN